MSAGVIYVTTAVSICVYQTYSYEERVVWHGMVWYGMVWYGMVWYGMIWYGMVWYGMVVYVTLKYIKKEVYPRVVS